MSASYHHARNLVKRTGKAMTMISGWFYLRYNRKVCILLHGEDQYREFVCISASPDHVALQNALTIVDHVPYSAIKMFRDPLG